MRLLFCLLMVGLAGCTFGTDRAAVAEARHALACHSQVQCDRYWQRARQWVADNTPTGIHTETNWVIVTDYPGEFGFLPGYTVTKTATDDGGAIIAMSVACSTFLPCIPSRNTMIERFNQFVLAP